MLYRRHAHYLLAVSARLLASRSEGEEVVQDTFVVGFQQLATLREPAAVRAWLAQIAVSLVRRRLRRGRLLRFLGLDRAPEDATLAALAAPELRPDDRAELALVDRMLARTPTDLRIAWMLRRVEGLALAEVACACASAPSNLASAAATGSGAPGPPAPTRMASAQSWRDLARHGRHGEAFAVLGADGLARESGRLGVNDLLALADVARLSGHPAEAVAPLERILTDFASDAQASLAAFALGRLELDSLGRAQAAAAALNKALALGIPRSLREDVRARLVEAYARGGDPSAARRAAAAYFEEYPHGRHARAIEGWLHPR